MYKLPEGSHYLRPPIEGAIATAEGWRHPKTNELLIAVRGLPTNDMAETPVPPDVSESISNDVTLPPVGDASPTDPLTDNAAPANTTDSASQDEAKKDDEAPLFSFENVEGGIEVTILAPNQHKYTKWTVAGVEIAEKGNTIVVQAGAEFTAKSPKGEFTGKA